MREGCTVFLAVESDVEKVGKREGGWVVGLLGEEAVRKVPCIVR